MTRARELSKLGNTQGLSVDNSFNIGINSTVPTATLDVRGNTVITGVVTATSFSGTVDATGLTGSPSITVTDITASGNVSIAGTLTYEDVTNIDAVGVITARSDVSIADKIIHTGDTNTAIRFPAADNFTVETGGSERFRVGPTGIATFTGNVSLIAGGAERLNIAHVSGGDVLIKNPTDAYLAFGTNDSERVRITNTGKIGIGSDTPTRLLVVAGSDPIIRSEDTDAANTYAEFKQIEGSLFIDSRSNTSDGTIVFRGVGGGSATEKLRIDSAGDMGLGVTPNNVGSQRTLHIKGPSGEGAAIRLQDNGDTADSDDFWIFKNSSAAYLRVNGTDPLRFYLNAAERAIINSSGNFLVGHDSAADSNDRIEISNTFGGRMGFLRNDTSTAAGNNIGMLSFYGNDSNGTYQETARISAEADLDHATDDKPGRLLFYTTADGASSVGTERVRIDSKGVITAKNGAVAEIDTLTSASTVTPDFAASCNFTLTLGHNVTLANPSNLTAGQSGSIFLIQDGTGSRTITFGSNYDFAGGTAPTLSTAASSVDRLDYFVRTSSSIHCVVTLAYS